LRKIFEHEFYTPFRVERVEIDGVRHYATPSGMKYKSVTTILGEKTDKTALMEWRKRVGDVEANKISTQAANRGTAVHDIAEQYLLNQERYPKGVMSANIDTFKKIRPILDERIGKVFGLEYYLYSDTLKTAGATDCIAEFDGINSIVDFKTSRKLKKEEWIENYFLQATCYAMMTEERLPIIVPQIVIMIAVDHEEPQIFIKDKQQYIERVKQIFC